MIANTVRTSEREENDRDNTSLSQSHCKVKNNDSLIRSHQKLAKRKSFLDNFGYLKYIFMSTVINNKPHHKCIECLET